MGIFRRKSSGDRSVPRAARFTVDVPREITGLFRSSSIAPRISRREALQVPAVYRARNLICSTLASLPLKLHSPDHSVRPWSLFEQIDPNIPNSVTWAYTYEDLLFESVAWWRVLERGAPFPNGRPGWPLLAEYIAHDRVHEDPARSGLQSLVTPDLSIPKAGGRVYVDGVFVPDQDLIRFDSPNPPLLVHGAKAIRTCLQLDDTAARYANEPIGLGYFESSEPGVDPFEDEEDSDGSLEKFLNDWSMARKRHAWGWIPPGVKLGDDKGFSPRDLQLADARQHAVLEISRLTGIDAEDLGVSVTSRTYANRVERNQDRINFTLGAYVSAVQDRLSMGDVSPRGSVARITFDAFLQADPKTRMETYKLGREVGVWADDDEVRDDEGKPPLTPSQQVALADRRTPAMPEPAARAREPEREMAQ